MPAEPENTDRLRAASDPGSLRHHRPLIGGIVTSGNFDDQL